MNMIIWRIATVVQYTDTNTQLQASRVTLQDRRVCLLAEHLQHWWTVVW